IEAWQQDRCVLVASHDWLWLLQSVPTGWWCSRHVGGDFQDLSYLWYTYETQDMDPLAKLWRRLLQKGCVYTWGAWINPQQAAQELWATCPKWARHYIP
ncbi:MAG: hypothetical protein OWS74_05650, partial [Firmicutes bacterium]|nr:hypothetical protein [Bacillota bacterium]